MELANKEFCIGRLRGGDWLSVLGFGNTSGKNDRIGSSLSSGLGARQGRWLIAGDAGKHVAVKPAKSLSAGGNGLRLVLQNLAGEFPGFHDLIGCHRGGCGLIADRAEVSA
jgi:hypothetical protein